MNKTELQVTHIVLTIIIQ